MDGHSEASLSSKVFLINPEGHTGLAYPDYGICESLVTLGVDVTYLTCREYPLADLAHSCEVVPFFVGEAKSRLLSAVIYCWAVVRLLAYLWGKPPAILHLEALRIPVLDSLFLVGAKARGFKLALMVHDVHPLDARLRLWMLPSLYRLADALLVFSQSAQTELVERYGIDESRITVVPQSGFKHLTRKVPSKREAREKLQIPASGKVILSFGVLRRSKGQTILVNAMPILLQAVPEALLIVAGKPTRGEDKEIEGLIHELELGDSVLLDARFIPDEEVPTFFAAADVVALPYLRSYHSSVLEIAHSFGKPVVASRVGGLPELIEEGKTGLLVTPGSAEALAECLIRILGTNEKMLADMTEALDCAAKQRPTWLDPSRQILAVYRSLGYST